jgi:DNA polymerase
MLTGDWDIADLSYSNVPGVLSELIRTAFVPSLGNKFTPSDFSAIEARVIAWLAGEQWRLDVFNTHGKIYEASAARMFKVTLESIGKKSPYRDRGKVSELALGYQGGVNALIQMGALKMGIPESELPDIVDLWRSENPAIVKLWKTVNTAAVKAVGNPGKMVTIQHGIKFFMRKGILFIQLPSGRLLSYMRAKLKENRFGAQAVTYEGLDKKWTRLETYGGKLVENIVQAIARDILRDAMLRVDAAGFDIVMHVHDEIVPEVGMSVNALGRLNEIMGEPVAWAPGLPLCAETFETPYYKKDDA